MLAEAIVDGMMITALMTPFLYLFLYRPMAAEIGRRRSAEEELEALNRNLEKRVEEKIAEHSRTNERLTREISEKQQARSEIWRDRDFIRSITEAAPCLYLIYDVNSCRCVFANSQVEDLLGYSTEAILDSGRDFLKEVMTAEAYSDFIEGLLEPDDPGQSTRDLGKIRMRKRSGEWQTMNGRYAVLRSDSRGQSLEVLMSAIESGD